MRPRAGRGALILGVALGGMVTAAWGEPAPADTVSADLGTTGLGVADTLGAASLSTGPYRSAVGATIGLPQLLGVTWETEPLSPFRFQANLGSILLIWSANARLLLIPSRWSVQPYVFGGGGAMFGVELEDFDGFAGYAWMGYGARLRVTRILVYGEMSFFWADETTEGPGVAGGVLWEY